MATLNVPNRNFNATPQTFGPVTLVTSGVTIQLTSTNWTGGLPLRVFFEKSLDNGSTWQDWSDDTFLTGAVSRSGALPSITLLPRDSAGAPVALQARVTVSAPNGTVNAGAVITF